MTFSISRKAMVAAVAVLATLAAVGVGYAAIPGADGVIHACYQKPGLLANPGAVRVVDQQAGQRCRSNEVAFDFNQKGPKGDVGPQGVKGDPGPQRQPGQVRGYEIVVAHEVHEHTVEARCPAGKKVLGGGAAVFSTNQVGSSYPSPDGRGWTASEVKATNIPGSRIDAWAICADVDE